MLDCWVVGVGTEGVLFAVAGTEYVVAAELDGDDGCNENVCKVAQRIAVEQPRLRVNVVNIGDSSLSNCIAENTGGSIYSSRNASDLANALKNATQAVSECQ